MEGSRIGRGAPIAEGEVIPQHTTPPLAADKNIPNKTGLMKVAEKADQRVLDTRLAKERKKQNAPPRQPAKKRPAGESTRPSKKRTNLTVVEDVDLTSDEDETQTHSPSPINIHRPEETSVTHEQQDTLNVETMVETGVENEDDAIGEDGGSGPVGPTEGVSNADRPFPEGLHASSSGGPNARFSRGTGSGG